LYAFHVGGDTLPQLEREFYTALAGYSGIHVDGDRLLVWNDERLVFHELDDDGSLVKLAEAEPGGAIKAGIGDGELVWLLVDGPFVDNTWQAYRDGQLVALRSDGVTGMLFDANQVYEKLG